MADRVQRAADALIKLLDSGKSLEEAVQYLSTRRLYGSSPTAGVYTAEELTEALALLAQRKGQRDYGLTDEELMDILDDLIAVNLIDEDQAHHIFNLYGTPEVQSALTEYTSVEDLQERIASLGLEAPLANMLYMMEYDRQAEFDDIKSAMKVRAGQAAVEKQREAEIAQAEKEQLAQQKIRAIESRNKQIAAQREAQQAIPGINELNAFQASPYVTEQDRAGYNQFEQSLRAAATTKTPYTFYEGDEPVTRYADTPTAQDRRSISEGLADRLARTVLGARSRAAGEEQANQAYIAGTRTGTAPVRREYSGVLPGIQPEVDRYLKETGLEPGDRLRSFIESKLGEVIKEVQPAREAWLQRLVNQQRESEEDDGDEDYDSEVARIGAEGAKWGRIAGVASAAPYTAGTYWGEGGLAGIAQQAYESSQAKLAALSQPQVAGTSSPAYNMLGIPVGQTPAWMAQKSAALAAYQPQRTPEEDPLIVALRNRNFESEYMMLPAGQRGVSYNRFAPRTTVRY